MSYPPNTIPENHDDQQMTLKKILLSLTGGAGGSGTPGIPITPPTVNNVKVVGIAETRNYEKALTTTPKTIPAGALAVTIVFSSDFVGTIGTLDYTGASQAAYSDAAQPGNVLPAIVVTRSAGSYSVITAGAT